MTKIRSGLVGLVLVLGCGPQKKGPTALSNMDSAAPAPSGIVSLTSVRVEGDDQNPKIIFDATGTLSPNIFKLGDPDRIVIDMTETRLNGVQELQSIKKGPIVEISASQFDDEKSSLSRVVVVLGSAATYEAKSTASGIELELKTDGSAQASAIPTIVGEDNSNPGSMFTADTSPVPVLNDTAVENRAKVLKDVQYFASSQGTSVRLIGDGDFATYQDFLLAGPDRVVVDLKGIQNKFSKTKSKTIAVKTKEVSQIRLGVNGEDVRIVLDGGQKNKVPNYQVTREPSALVVSVQYAQEGAPVASVSAPVEPVLPVEPSFEPSADMAPVTQTESVQNASKSVLTAIDFTSDKGSQKSIIKLTLDQAAQYTTEKEGNTVVLNLLNTKIGHESLKRMVYTKEFVSDVSSVVSEQKGSVTQVRLVQKEGLPYRIKQVGNEILVDVDAPAMASVEMDKIDTTPVGVEVAQKPEVIINEPAVQKEGAQPGKSYAYVKEEFMSDSVGSDEPLSQMGSILAGSVDGKKFSGRKISLDFKDADVRSIFRLIADISKFNIIISDDVEGRISVRLDDVPWDQAFAIILQTRGLWFEKYGNIVRVAPADKLRREREASAAAARAAVAAKPLDVLFKPVSFAEAGTLLTQIRGVLSERGTVDSDSRTNTLIIKDVREHLDKAKRMVDILDTPTPQVTIEARIVEASASFVRSFGIRWSGNTRFSSQSGNPTGLFFPNNVNISPFAMNFPAVGAVNTTGTISLGSINNIIDLDLQLALGEQEGHSKLISAPKVTVLDNRAANITAGTRIPFVTQTANAGSNVRFENAATSLSVTPHITNDGSVLMTINATRNEPNFSTSAENPSIDQRSANTEVLVKSGNTTVIGGIYSTQTGQTQDRLPFLHHLPIIGFLFKNHNKIVRRSELLIFVTPRIVEDDRKTLKDIRG